MIIDAGLWWGGLQSAAGFPSFAGGQAEAFFTGNHGLNRDLQDSASRPPSGAGSGMASPSVRPKPAVNPGDNDLSHNTRPYATALAGACPCESTPQLHREVPRLSARSERYWVKARQRGSALIAVLWLSAALSAIAFAMSVTVRGETARTATSRDDLRSYYLASAGVERATMELLWTAAQGVNLIPKNSTYIDYDFPSGVAHVEIIPEAAKLNVNRVSVDQLFALLTALGIDPARATTIAAGIVDWRSPGAGGSPFDAYYLSLTPSFQAPHTSFQEIEELLSVKGVTPDIFYGTWAPSGNGDASEIRWCATPA